MIQSFREWLEESEKESNSSLTVKPKTKKELQNIIQNTIDKEGPDCDLNFINTSEITDMSRLFLRSCFNGDISKWNVSKVKICLKCSNFQALLEIFQNGMYQMLKICLACLWRQKLNVISRNGMFQKLKTCFECFLALKERLLVIFQIGMFQKLVVLMKCFIIQAFMNLNMEKMEKNLKN